MADAGSLFERALRFHQQGRFADAVAAYRDALRRDPKHAAAQNNLGMALQRLGNHDGALRCFEQVAALQPNDARVHINLASAAMQAGRPGLAVDHLATAYRLAPNDFGTRERLVALVGHVVPTGAAPNVEAALDALASDPAVDPGRLVPAVLARLKAAEPVVRALTRITETGRPFRGEPSADLIAALSRPAFLTLLGATIIADDDIETVLTALRSAWLEQAFAMDESPTPDLMAAVALQTHATEWAYDETEAEQEHLEELERRLDAPDARWGAEGGPSLALLAYALYRPLARFAGDARLRRAAVRADGELVRRHVLEPEAEAALAERLPVLTRVTGDVSERVRHQYEVSPYPRWRRLPRRAARPIGDVLAEALDDPSLATDLGRTAPHVLIAGCGTGRHACATATRFAGAKVLAVDLSRASLAYAARQGEALGIGNLTFGQADILELRQLAERFDVVESSGVLHHMADPESGWRVLRDLLKPRGLMRIALYSVRGRAGVDAARQLVAQQHLEPTPDGLREARALIRAQPADAPARAFAASADFFSLSGCRDMLFHAHEDRFTLPRITAALTMLDLEFLGFELPDPRIRTLYRERFPADSRTRDLGNWERLEADNPSLFAAMYQFWCRART